jgi:hypothetical protein
VPRKIQRLVWSEYEGVYPDEYRVEGTRERTVRRLGSEPHRQALANEMLPGFETTESLARKP